MEFLQFFQTVGAVMAGNLLSAVFIWFMIQASRNEAQGKHASDQPWILGLWMLIACGVLAGAVLSVVY